MIPALAVYFGLILARVAAFVIVMPLFASRTPRTIKAALVLVLSLFYFSSVAPQWDGKIANQAENISVIAYALALIREALIGAMLGFLFNLFLLPVRIAGEFVTQFIGLPLSPQAGPTGETPAGPITLILEAAAAMVFLELEGHHVALAALHATFAQFPLGGIFFPQPAEPMVQALQNAHRLGLLLAAPLALFLLLLTITLAIMTRAAPQLNIYSIGFSLQVLVAILGTLFLLPDLIRVLIAIFGQMAQTVNFILT